jgi:hypothetical protein
MADIKLEDFTSGYTDGSGVFDVLMTAISSRLQEQYELDRLKGSDYATAYLGAMQYAMSQGLQFLLGEQQADKQADLLQQQIDASKAQVIREDALAEVNIRLLEAQILKTHAETALLIAKKNTEDAQIVDAVNGSDVVGLVGKQKNLYQKQADGFDRDAEQKALKLMVDLWSVGMTADPDGIRKPRWIVAEDAFNNYLEDAFQKAVNNAFPNGNPFP